MSRSDRYLAYLMIAVMLALAVLIWFFPAVEEAVNLATLPAGIAIGWLIWGYGKDRRGPGRA